MSQIIVPISVGEFIDKLTILEIKTERINDSSKLLKATIELQLLTEVFESHNFPSDLLTYKKALKKVNQKLWIIEDNIREKERNLSFDKEFIRLARQVYLFNDKRFEIKNKINILCNSLIYEVKSY